MNRIWNCITRSFRARPATSPQTTSQCNDDELPVSSPESEVKKFILKYGLENIDNDRLVTVPIGDKRKVVTWIEARKRHRKNNGKFNDEYEVYFKVWDNIVFGAASALLLGPLARFFGNVVYRKSNKDETREIHEKLTLQERWNQEKSDFTVFPNNSTLRSVLSKVPLPSAVAYAAGEVNKPSATNQIEVQKLCSNENIGNSLAQVQPHLHHSIGNENTVSCNPEAEDKKEFDKIDEILTEEDLERFLLSAQQCVGLTYYKQGILSYKAGNYKDAFQFFQLGSSGGSSRAQFNLALCYHYGRGTKKDIVKAKKEYKRAARQGHRVAQYNLAILLLEEKEDVVKIKHALFLLEKSAEQGLVQAQAMVGSYYAREGIHQNMKTAVRMFKLATDNEDPLSTYHLAQCYEHGLGGLEVDNAKAFDLYATAASLNHHAASFKMAMMLLNGCAGAYPRNNSLWAKNWGLLKKQLVQPKIESCVDDQVMEKEIERNEELAMEILKKTGDLGHEESAKKFAQLKKTQEKNKQTKKLNSVKHENPIQEQSVVKNPSFLPSDVIDISQLMTPEVLPFGPANLSGERRLSATPIFQGLSSFAEPLYDRRACNVMHRVSSMPSNMVLSGILAQRPSVSK